MDTDGSSSGAAGGLLNFKLKVTTLGGVRRCRGPEAAVGGGRRGRAVTGPVRLGDRPLRLDSDSRLQLDSEPAAAAARATP